MRISDWSSDVCSSDLIISPFPSTCALIMFGFIGYATLSYGRSVPALCEQKGAHSSIERTYYMTVEQDPGPAASFEPFGTYILPAPVNHPPRRPPKPHPPHPTPSAAPATTPGRAPVAPTPAP